MVTTSELGITEGLRHRGVLLGLLARLFGPEVAAGSGAATLGEAVAVAEALGDGPVVEALERAILLLGPLDASTLAGRAIHWFEHGRVAPYEYSNVGSSAGGHTSGLADVAGFYRAFGVRPVSDRPDHLVAELDFMALVLLMEADAVDAGRDDDAQACARSARTFLRDHLGRWVDTWAARIADAAPDEPWGALGVATARAVAAEARRRNVIPLRESPVFGPGDAPLVDDPVGCEQGLVDMWAIDD